MDAELARLPWRYPFRLIDRTVDCVRRERIVTEKLVTAGDPVVYSDEGGGPWLPAMLILEALSQTAALLYRRSFEGSASAAALPLLGFLSASLKGSAQPGEVVTFEVCSMKMTRSGGVFEARARVGDRELAEGQLAFSSRGEGA